MGCKGSDEQKYNRAKEIAELLKELRVLNKEQQSIADPRTPTQPKFNHAILDGSTTKKDRKEAKKAAKAAERTPFVTSKDVERISQILCPEPEEAVDGEFERALLTDASINDNLNYHRATGNSRETRHRIINKERSLVFATELLEEEMNRVLAELRVPSWAELKTKAERAIVVRLRDKITENLVHNNNEARDTMARKAGFWRWASRRAYNRLIENGRIWDWKNGDALAHELEADEDDGEDFEAGGNDAEGEEEVNAVNDEVAAAVNNTINPTANRTVVRIINHANHAVDLPANYTINTPANNAVDNTIADARKLTAAIERVVDGHAATDDRRSLATEPSRFGSISSSTVSRDTSVSSATRTTMSSAGESSDEGWTTVGKTSLKRATPKLKLSSNGGLKHLGFKAMSISPRTPRASRTPVSLAAFGMLSINDGDEESTEDDEASPLTPCPKRR